MNIAVEAELRLVQVIREARLLIVEMQDMKKDFIRLQGQVPVAAKMDRKFLAQQIVSLNSRINVVTQSIHSASVNIDKMHGNLKWKEAVFEVYGEKGIQDCIAYFARIAPTPPYW